MDLGLTEEQKLLQKSVREFAESEVRPLAKEHDETGHFPRELFKKSAELGLTGVPFPESEGGAGFDHIAYTIANWDTDKNVKPTVEAELKRRGLQIRTTEGSFHVQDPDGFEVQMGGKEQ